MLIKEADKIIISLSKPEKMPGFAYGLPAWECKTGAKLAKVPGSVCSGCYAMKGNYTRFPDIKRAQYKRLAAIRHGVRRLLCNERQLYKISRYTRIAI